VEAQVMVIAVANGLCMFAGVILLAAVLIALSEAARGKL